jgi:hypothetical protein
MENMNEAELVAKHPVLTSIARTVNMAFGDVLEYLDRTRNSEAIRFELFGLSPQQLEALVRFEKSQQQLQEAKLSFSKHQASPATIAINGRPMIGP